MLQTVSKNNHRDRYVRTAAFVSRTAHKISLQQNQSTDVDKWMNQSYVRPGTTPLTRTSNYTTLNSTGKSSRLVDIKSVEEVESQLSDRFKEDMNSYLKKKLRYYVDKKKQSTLACDGLIDSNFKSKSGANETISSMGKPLDELYSLSRPKLRLQEGIDQAHLLNAKERILRLIERKKQRQSRYHQLSRSIKLKNSKKQSRIRSITLDLKNKTIQDEEWLKEWDRDHSNQNPRYRHRLFAKGNRNNQFFSISQQGPFS